MKPNRNQTGTTRICFILKVANIFSKILNKYRKIDAIFLATYKQRKVLIKKIFLTEFTNIPL